MDKPDKELNEHDLKSIKDWIKYYNNLYDKRGGQKYATKLAELVLKLQEKEKIVKGNFQKAFADAAASRIIQSMFTDGNVYKEATPAGLKIISSQELHDDFLKQIKKEKEDGSE